MKTIEERAIALMNTLPCEEPKSLVYDAYKLGATEQKQIDIDKACEWWKSRGEVFGITPYQIERFRKAMEE